MLEFDKKEHLKWYKNILTNIRIFWIIWDNLEKYKNALNVRIFWFTSEYFEK